MSMNKISSTDFNKICRICLNFNIEMISIYNSDILTNLKSFTNVQFDPGDDLPKEICSECVHKINECIQFIKLCNESDYILHQIVLENEDNKWINNDNLDTTKTIDEKFILFENNEINKAIKSEIEIKISDTHSENKENKITNESSDNNFYIDNLNNYESSDESEEEKLKFKLPSDGKMKLSIRKARINWVRTLGPEKCDIDKLLCKLCNKTLVNVSSLGRHMETHDKNRKFLISCNTCQKGFYEKGNYMKHMQRHKRETKYKCDKCSKAFYELNVLATHLKKSHGAKPISCTQCNKKFIIKEQMEIHMKKHANEFEHVCPQCGKGYYLLRRLKEHLLSHKKTYICEPCNKTYKNYTSLKSHNDRYHRFVQEKQNCVICGKTVLHIKQHMLIHSGDRMFKCSICLKTFYRRCDMVAHVKRKHEQSTKPVAMPYLCNICGKKKLSNSALQQHIIHAHTNEKTQKCHLCEKRFKTENALKGHIRYSHKDVRNYKCNVCSKSFYTNVILRNHMRTHTGERPYVCHICNRAFVQSSTLRTHMKIHAKADYDR